MTIKKFFHSLLSILFCLSLPAHSAVILQYHHVSETLPAVTSVSAETFTEHLNYLKQHDFNVVPLNELLSALQQGQSLQIKPSLLPLMMVTTIIMNKQRRY